MHQLKVDGFHVFLYYHSDLSSYTHMYTFWHFLLHAFSNRCMHELNLAIYNAQSSKSLLSLAPLGEI